MKKKLSLLLAVLSLAFLFVSCGGEKTYPVEFVLSDVTAKAGETVSVEIYVNSTVDANAFALYQLAYDEDVLEFSAFANLGEAGAKSFFGEAGLDQEKKTISIALMETEKLTGKICEIQFKVKAGAKAGSAAVSMVSVVKNGSTPITSNVKAGSVTVTE